MDSNALWNAFRGAGLTDEDVRLITENKVLATLIVQQTQKICAHLRQTFPTTPPTEPKYLGPIPFDRIPQVVANLKARAQNVTYRATAEGLECSETALVNNMQKYPYIRRMYQEAKLKEVPQIPRATVPPSQTAAPVAANAGTVPAPPKIQ